MFALGVQTITIMGILHNFYFQMRYGGGGGKVVAVCCREVQEKYFCSVAHGCSKKQGLTGPGVNARPKQTNKETNKQTITKLCVSM